MSVTARRAGATRILIQSNDSRVPTDGRNTVCKMLTRALAELRVMAEVEVYIQKNLPIQGGMGAGSANAAAALIGLEKELGLALDEAVRLRIAAEVGSDVPLFLIGGAVLGSNRGEVVRAVPELTLAGEDSIHCVMAIPKVGVSTPQAFRDWDARYTDPDLHNSPVRDTLGELSRVFASIFGGTEMEIVESGASGIFADSSSGNGLNVSPEQSQGLGQFQGKSETSVDLAENSLLALVRTGIENDFEQVVFLQYPSLHAIKRQLMGSDSDVESKAIYAALSGSGSALFGLYRSEADAEAAQQRVQSADFGCKVQVFLTKTLPRESYWRDMIAE
ncbi:4-(cytidine 5'-diphospho)-2-C-methyl-D-erythritol kinase [Granulicella rosea]|uniref:4-(cytidine 5'-diphospho)-2-C-methyl-D-erythritol kinase n=1 Tax=Granulicella rosea TaxID=474952 RepID=UPI00318373AE